MSDNEWIKVTDCAQLYEGALVKVNGYTSGESVTGRLLDKGNCWRVDGHLWTINKRGSSRVECGTVFLSAKQPPKPASAPTVGEYAAAGTSIGTLVESKQVQYGDSVTKSAGIMKILYPNGVPVHALSDALLTVRVIDKLCRIAQRGDDGKDLGGESPWQDIAGYGVLGRVKDERKVKS